MRKKLNILIAGFCLVFFSSAFTFAAEDFAPFYGEVTGDNINVRSDSTITAQTVCMLARGDTVNVVSELYEWYKIRLPKNAPSFIKKDFITLIDDKTAKVLADNVNIRLAPDGASVIVGRINKDEVVSILNLEGGWYRIPPVKNSFGWIHRRFIKRTEPPVEKALEPDKTGTQETVANPDAKSAAIEKIISEIKTEIKIEQEKLAEKTEIKQDTVASQPVPAGNTITIEGRLEPNNKFFKRIATHYLVTENAKLFLIKGDTPKLNEFTYRKVKITGKIISPPEDRNPVLEVENIASLN
jgi:uncharacterized protein YgiM (DUF1202 family)